VRGFTLIELLVVFTLLALLLSIAVPRYVGSMDSSRDKVRQQNMATIRDALDKFRADQGRYPGDLGELVSKQYLRSVPVDPVSETNAWVPVKPPSGVEAGIYDVLPPGEKVANP
jgi:general secretion pathway protein G